jgi:hypothetical protein
MLNMIPGIKEILGGNFYSQSRKGLEKSDNPPPKPHYDRKVLTGFKKE